MIEPTWELHILIPIIHKAIRGGANVFQVWNKWNEGQDKHQVIGEICAIAHAHDIPVFINEDWKLLTETALDGIHFDDPPDDLNAIRSCINRPFLSGITCGNDLKNVHWAENNTLSYISFCSMFPSSTAGACEIVDPETVKAARLITKLPIFLAGGITIENVAELGNTGMDGVAVFSAVMSAVDPETISRTFKNLLNQYHYEKNTHR